MKVRFLVEKYNVVFSDPDQITGMRE